MRKTRFKPYYKWITFNTIIYLSFHICMDVLNLIINGLPSILNTLREAGRRETIEGFKPYYKWITFNTYVTKFIKLLKSRTVLNLIINGLPSIHKVASISSSIKTF